MNALTAFQKEVLAKIERGETVGHSYKAVARALEKKGLIRITVVMVRHEHNGQCFGVTREYKGEIVAQPGPEAMDGTVIVDVYNERERWTGNAVVKGEIMELVNARNLKRVKFGEHVAVGHYSAKAYRPSGSYGGSGDRTKFTFANKDWMYLKLSMTNLEGAQITRG